VLEAYRADASKIARGERDLIWDHTASVYLMDKVSRFVAPFNLERRPEEAAAELRRYL
jgi:protein SCO1/2